MTDFLQTLSPGYLLAGLILFWLVTAADLLRRDRFFFIFYSFLFIYSIFSIIGYTYFPQYSMMISAYFGQRLASSYIVFVGLSMLATYAALVYADLFIFRRPLFGILTRPSFNRRVLFYGWILFYLFMMTAGAAVYFKQIDYQLEPQFPNKVLGFGYKQLAAVVLLLYALYRSRMVGKKALRRIHLASLLGALALLITLAIKVSGRTDLFALTIGLSCFEILPHLTTLWNARKIILKWTVVVALIVAGLMEIYYSRSKDIPGEVPLSQKILVQDYYAPAHMLFAVMALDWVNPGEVWESNIHNLGLFSKTPFLQQTVADAISPLRSTRDKSYAFYIFTEGYMVMGWLGFIYNGLVVSLGIVLLRFFSQSTHPEWNRFAFALCASQAANLVRGQSMYFPKEIMLWVLPIAFLYLLGSGMQPVPMRKVLTAALSASRAAKSAVAKG